MKYLNNKKSTIASSTMLVTALLTVSLYSTSASANHVVSVSSVETIKNKQAKSIKAGIQLGRLTPREARKLRKEQKDILRTELKMRKDGALNAAELGELFKKLQFSQTHINKLLRNSISTAARSSVNLE